MTQVLHHLHRPTQTHSLKTPSSFPAPSRDEGKGVVKRDLLGWGEGNASPKQQISKLSADNTETGEKVRCKGLWVKGSNRTH